MNNMNIRLIRGGYSLIQKGGQALTCSPTPIEGRQVGGKGVIPRG